VTDRLLIVNADDLGQSPGIDRGIAEAHTRGIVTSGSLMVRWPSAAEAAAMSGSLDLGLHIDLGEWRFAAGKWTPAYEVVPLLDAEAIEREIAGQLDVFRELVGGEPTHLDSHQHVHMKEPVRGILARLARELGVPLRGVRSPARYLGDFYGQTADGVPLHEAITSSALISLAQRLPEGATELGCHPGEDVELDTMYRSERALEVQALCDPSVLAAIEEAGVRLCSFSDLPSPLVPGPAK